MEKDDIVRFIGVHQYLETGKEYKVFTVSETGIQICIPTGFVGIPIDAVILTQMG